MKRALLLLPLFLAIAPATAQYAPTQGAPIAVAHVLAATPVVSSFALDLFGDEQEKRDIALSIYPNPAVDEATVTFTLERAQRITLDVFDVLGRHVLQDDLGVISAGAHEVRLDLRRVPVGLYIIRLTGDAGARATIRVTRAMGA